MIEFMSRRRHPSDPPPPRDQSGVQHWLQQQRDGGWSTADERERRRIADRLLYVLTARSIGLFRDE